MKSTNDLTDLEANAVMIMLNEAMELHFHHGSYFDCKDWEYFDLDAARLTGYKKFRVWYEDKYGELK